MTEKVLDYIQFHKSKYAKRVALLLVLSVVVVTGVFWRLKLTGITLAGEAFCGKDEHAHTEECLAEGCTREEHIHDTLCYANPEADLETALDWEATLESAPDTEFYTSDLLAVAESQLGYAESSRNFILGQDGARCGYTRYGQWYGNPYGEWSAMFASFCLHYAGIPEEFAPRNSGAETMRVEWGNAGLLFARNEYDPIPGDLIFFDTDADGNAESVGILTSRSGSNLTVIQGDVDGAVAAVTYLSNDGRILSYGSMNAVLIASATESELEYVEYTIEYIDGLPTYEEVDETLLSLEEDIEAYEEYFLQVGTQARTAYNHSDSLGRLLPLVSNYSKSQDLEWLWQSEAFIRIEAENIIDVPVYAVNPKESAVTSDIDGGRGWATIVYGGSPYEVYYSYYPDNYDKRIAETCTYFKYWEVYVIAKDPSQGYYVKDYQGSGEQKPYVEAPDGGFLYFVHASDANFGAKIPLGTFITVSDTSIFTIEDEATYPFQKFDTANTITSNTPIAKLITGPAALPKTPVNNSGKLTTVETVDTKDFIRINLFDYGEKISGLYNINDPYNSSTFYPVFKLRETVDVDDNDSWDSLTYFGFDLGDLVAYDVERQTSGVNTDDTINDIINGNQPLAGYVYPKLVDGYPYVYGDTEKTTTLSLQYLFHGESGYTKQQNDKNITNLLLFDEETGAYYYDSRKNFAQFDAATDTFIVYDQILTPGFAVYPFGNFMPLNDITTQATQVTSINREWFRNVAHNAWYKYVTEADKEYVDIEEYRDIYIAIAKLIPLMDEKYGTNWHYGDVLDEYFGRTATPDLPEDPVTGGNAQAHLSNLYTLDYDEATNFHFGMDMHMDFMMPKNGMTGKGGKYEMVYTFSGDDDVWVYIDGVLFLDLSGTHRHVGGEINFAKGEVYYYYLNTDKGDVYTYEELVAADGTVDETKGRVVTFKEILVAAGYTEEEATAMLNDKGTFANYTEHTFDFYYMERGAGSGVCSMYFNMPPLQENRISVAKEMDNVAADAIGNPKFEFQILKEGTEAPFIGENVSYQVLDANGNVVDTRTTGKNGVFFLYATERAVFAIPENAGRYFVRELLDPKVFEQYGEVVFEVDGSVTTADSFTNVTVGSTAFMGVDSPSKDASDGNTTFIFQNKVTAENYGALEIVKTAKEYSDTAEVGTFTFSLLFGNRPVAIGTPYILIDADGNETEMTVTTEGRISLKAGERVRFKKVLAGTFVTIKELNGDGYFVEYTGKYDSGDSITLTKNTDGSVTAPISASLTMEFSVFNDRIGEKVTVGGEKVLLHPDGTERTYTIVLEQITAFDNLTVLPGGVYQAATVTLTKNGTFNFTLNYPGDTAPGTYYYRIYEKDAVAANGDDTSYYILAVTVDKNGEKLRCTPVLYKNGAQVDNLTFQNRNVRSLTVTKTVEGVTGEGFTFDFTVNAVLNGANLNGTYLTDAGTIEFTNGIATFTLGHGESLTILDLPYGTVWTAVEAKADGFYTEHAIGNGERVVDSAATGSLTENATVDYYNIGGAELPATGGFNRDLFPLVGAVLMLGSTAGAVVYRKKQK